MRLGRAVPAEGTSIQKQLSIQNPGKGRKRKKLNKHRQESPQGGKGKEL